jgi:hypothetical protein
VIAMPEPAFTAEPLRAGLVGDELRQTPVLMPTAATDGRQDFHKMQGAVVVNVLDGVVEQQ